MAERWQWLGTALIIFVGAFVLALLFHFARLPGLESPPAFQTNIETILWWVTGLSLVGAAIIYGIGKLIDMRDRY